MQITEPLFLKSWCSHQKNIEMVFSGHIGAPDDPRKHVGFRIDKNSAGKDVSQMTFNAQALGVARMAVVATAGFGF